MMLDAHLKKYGMKHCPIDNSVKILRNMILLKHEFIDSIEGTSTKTLSVRSKEMKEDGLIYRVVVSSRPIHTEQDILADIYLKYEPKVIFKDGRPRTGTKF